MYLCPHCGLCSVSADREQEDGAALKSLPVFCVICEVFLQSVRFYFHAGHPHAFHYPVSKNSAEDNLRPVGFLSSSCLKVQVLSDYCSCKG